MSLSTVIFSLPATFNYGRNGKLCILKVPKQYIMFGLAAVRYNLCPLLLALTFWGRKNTAVISHSGNHVSCYTQYFYFSFPLIILSGGLWIFSKHPRISKFWRCPKLNIDYFKRTQYARKSP